MKMYDSVLQRVKILEEKNGIRYTTTDSKLYNGLKIALIILFSFAALIKSFYFLGALVASQLQLPLITPAVCTALLVLGFVLLLFKQHIIGTVLITVSSAMLIFTFAGMLVDEYTEKLVAKFYWAHLIPLLALVVLAVCMTIIAVSAKVKLKRMYNRVVENIYNAYKINIANGETIEEDKWEEFLEKFDPTNYTSQFVSNRYESE